MQWSSTITYNRSGSDILNDFTRSVFTSSLISSRIWTSAWPFFLGGVVVLVCIDGRQDRSIVVIIRIALSLFLVLGQNLWIDEIFRFRNGKTFSNIMHESELVIIRWHWEFRFPIGTNQRTVSYSNFTFAIQIVQKDFATFTTTSLDHNDWSRSTHDSHCINRYARHEGEQFLQ